MKKNLLIFAILVAALNNLQANLRKPIMLKNVTVIDGSGRPCAKKYERVAEGR